MAKAGSVDLDVRLSQEGTRLLEMTEVMRRYGKLEALVPQAWLVLKEATEEELRQKVDVVFGQLFKLLDP